MKEFTKQILINILKIIFFFKFPSKNKKKNKKHIAIYLGGWLLSPLTCYVSIMALILKQKNFKITILYDKFNLHNKTVSIYYDFLIKLLLLVLKFKYKIPFYELSNSKEKKYNYQNIYEIEINKTLVINNIRYNENLNPRKLNKKIFNVKKNQLKIIIFNFRKFIKYCDKNTTYLIPGGYLNSSYLITKILRDEKKLFYTYDFSINSRNKSFVWYSKNGIAGRLEDSREVIKNLNKKKLLNSKKIRQIKNEVDKEILKRIHGKDLYLYQINSKEAFSYNSKNFILITLNSGWDANSIDSNYIFKNYFDFLEQTIKFVNKKFPGTKILIKDHPKRNTTLNSDDSIIKYLIYLKSKNYLFDLDCGKYNFYDLVKKSKLVISTASTTLSEAIIIGTPAISVGMDQYYYFKLGINPKNKFNYFDQLKKKLMPLNKIKLSNFLRQNAYILFYFNNILKLHQTMITPQNYNFLKMKQNDLFRCRDLNIVVKMLLTNKTYLELLIK